MCLDQADSRGWVGAPGEEMHVELWGFYVGNGEDESSWKTGKEEKQSPKSLQQNLSCGKKKKSWKVKPTLDSNFVCLVAKLGPIFCNPIDCSPSGSSVHGIFQARILEWVAISSSRESFLPRDRTGIEPASSAFAEPAEPPGKPQH